MVRFNWNRTPTRSTAGKDLAQEQRRGEGNGRRDQRRSPRDPERQPQRGKKPGRGKDSGVGLKVRLGQADDGHVAQRPDQSQGRCRPEKARPSRSTAGARSRRMRVRLGQVIGLRHTGRHAGPKRCRRPVLMRRRKARRRWPIQLSSRRSPSSPPRWRSASRPAARAGRPWQARTPGRPKDVP